MATPKARTKPKAKPKATTPVQPRRQAVEPFSGGDNPGVTTWGYAAEGYAEKNTEKYKFPCPRDHFIYGPPDLTAYAVAIHWGLHVRTVQKWAVEDGWQKLRDMYRENVPYEQGGYKETEKTALIKESALDKEVRYLTETLEITMARVRDQEEDQITPIGDVRKIKKKSASHKADVQALLEVVDSIRVATDRPTRLTGTFAGATFNKNDTNNITNILMVPEGADAATYGVQALPEPPIDAEVCDSPRN